LKQSRIPTKVMCYLPVSDYLRYFFSNPKDSYKRKKGDRKLRQPADACQWMKYDEKYYQEFGKDPRNVRLVLSTDGLNSFGGSTITYNIWPVILTMYNLPTWLCHKRNYLLLSILIQDPKHLGIDIYIFLEPLIQEIETLWKEGMDIIDGFRQQLFSISYICHHP